MTKKPTQTMLEIARRGEQMAKWKMVKEDIIILATTINAERTRVVGIAYWHDELPLAEIAKAQGLTKPRITQIAEMFFRMCLHPSRRRMTIAWRDGSLRNSSMNP